MEKNYELELNGKFYLLFDAVEYNGDTYYSAVQLDDKKKATTNYAYFRKYEKNGEKYIDIIRDNKELLAVTELFVKNIAKDYEDILFPAGTKIELGEREYVIMCYIPYSNDIYMMLVTTSEPNDMIIAKVIKERDKDEMDIEDVSHLPVAMDILRIHASLYGGVNN